MNNYREVIIFAKPTKFETIKLMHGGEYTSNNAKYICNLTTSKADSDVIAYGVSECKKIGLELGSITEVSTKKGGFYAGAKEHKKVVYDYAK
jgi:hypothetical protein